MDINGVFKELRLESFGDWLGTKTASGKDVLKRPQWTIDGGVLARRTAQIGSLRNGLGGANRHEELEEIFDQAATNEGVALEIIDTGKEGKEEFQEECYGQLLFRHEILRPINMIPFFLTILRFFKVFITPIMAVLMPLLTVVLPYIMIRFVFGLPMPVGQYYNMLKEFYMGNGFDGLLPTSQLNGQLSQIARAQEPKDMLGRLKLWAQTAGLALSFGQSMWQPIQSARHLATLDTTLCRQGAAVRAIYESAVRIRATFASMGIKVARIPFDESELADDRMAVAAVLDSPDRLRLLIQLIGEWETMYRFAVHPDICLVQWLPRGPASSGLGMQGQKPRLAFHKTFDIHLPADKCVRFSIGFGSQGHALLTGPNRGGKSTALRSIGRNVYLAHNYGVSVGVAAAMTPMDYIQTCLRLEDIPGSASLFEREVAVASLALQRAADPALQGIVLIDELFHSTNPPDAFIASQQFLERLWKSNGVITIISTHMFQLLEEATDKRIQLLCCPAKYNADRTVHYKYGLKPGICNVSSVYEILQEQGL
jgi:hypothetical protein